MLMKSLAASLGLGLIVRLSLLERFHTGMNRRPGVGMGVLGRG